MATISSLTADLNLNYGPFVSGFQKAAQTVSSNTSKMVADQQTLVRSFAQHQAALQAVSSAAISLTLAERGRIAADIAGYQQLAKSIQAEQQLESVRLQAQISEKGRQESINRSAQLTRDYQATQEKLAGLQQDMTRITEANTLALRQNAQATANVQAAQQKMAAQYQETINANLGVRTDFNASARAADVEAYGAALDQLRAKLNPTFAMSKQYEASINEINMALKVGAISEHEHAAALENARIAFERQTQYYEMARGATNRLGGSLTQLSFQINDIVSGLLMGQSPGQILFQQGGQVLQVWQMNNNVFKEVGQVIRSLLTPVNLLVGGLLATTALVTAAYFSYEAEQRRLQASTQGLGRSAGVTATELRMLAEQVSTNTGVTVAGAEATMTAMLATGQVYRQNLQMGAAVARDFAAQTGLSADEANKKLAAMAADPLKGIDDLAAAIGGITAAQREHIQTLLAQGKQEEAANAVMRAAVINLNDYRTGMSGLGRATDAFVNATVSGWRSVGSAIQDAYDWMVKYDSLGLDMIGLAPKPSIAPTAPTANIADINRANAATRNASNATGVDSIYALQTSAAEYQKTLDAVKNGTVQLSAAQTANVQLVHDRLVNAYMSLRDAQGDLVVSGERYLSQQQIEARQTELSRQMVLAHTATQRSAIAEEQKRLSLAGQQFTASEASTRAEAAGAEVIAQATKTIIEQNHVIALNIAANDALSAAWQNGSAAAMEAQARAQAANDAWQTGVNQQVRAEQLFKEAMTQHIASVSQSIRQSRDQVDAQKAANDAVAAGTLGYADMDRYIQQRLFTMEMEQLRAKALANGWGDVADEISRYIELQDKISADTALQAARQRALGLTNPYAQDQQTISALGGMGLSGPAKGLAVSQTSLGRDLQGLQQSIGQMNPFGAGAQIGMDASLQAIQQQEEQRKQIVQAALDAGLASAQQAAEMRVQIERDATDQIRQAYAALADSQLALGENAFASLAEGVGALVGKHTAAYKTIFAVEKAFQIARATLALETAIAQAMAIPWPANIPAIAQAITAGSQILSAIASISSAGFMLGGYTGDGPRSAIAGVVHGQEWVVNSGGVPGNTATLAAMNAGMKFDNLPAAANDTGNLSARPLKISITQEPGVAVEVVGVTPDEAVLIARRVLNTEGGKMMRDELSSANNVGADALARTTTARRLRS